MALPFDIPIPDLREAARDPRAMRILAKTIYRELRQSGLGEQNVIAFASELLSLIATDVKDRRELNGTGK